MSVPLARVFQPGHAQDAPRMARRKSISDTFEKHRAKLLAGKGDYAGANAEDPDEDKARALPWAGLFRLFEPVDRVYKHPLVNSPCLRS